MKIGLRTALIISIAVYFLVSWFHVYTKGISNPNERVRFFLVHAIVSRGEFGIDEEIKKFGNTIDKAEAEEGFYCDKAPMISFLSVPAYYLYYKIKSGVVTESESLYFLKLTLHSIFAVILFWLFFIYLFPIVKDTGKTLFFSFTSIFATPLFSFFTVYFSHSISATLLFAFFLLFRKSVSTSDKRLFFITGVIGGITFMTEYSLAIALTLISIFMFITSERKSPFFFFIIGGISVSALFFSYNTALFGSPFSIGYSNLADKNFAEAQSTGLWGITYPKYNAAIQTLFSLRTGLFVLTPVTLLILPASVHAFMKKNKEEILTIIVIISQFYVATGFSVWSGGGTFGARHLVPVFPFIMILTARYFLIIEHKSPFIQTTFIVLSVLSVIIFSTVTPLFSFFSARYTNPIANFTLIMIRENFFPSTSLLTLLGISNKTSYIIWLITIFITIIFLIRLYSQELFKKSHKVLTILMTSLTIFSLYFYYSANEKAQLSDAYMSMQKVKKSENYELKEKTYAEEISIIIKKISN